MAKSTKPDEPKSPSDDGKVEDQLSGIEPEAAEPGTEESTDATEDKYVPEESAALEDEAADESGNENPWDDADDGEDAYDGDRDVYDDDEDEAEEYRAAETAHAPAADYAPEESASIWPAVLGGVIAAVIGFLLGRAEVLDNYLPAGLQRPSVDLSEIQTALQRLADATAAQKARIDSLEATDASPDLEAIQTSVSSLESSQAELRSRLEAVEARPVAVEPVDDGKQDQALSELQQTLATQRQEIDRLADEIDSAKADAQSEAQRTLARAALTRVQTAVDSGSTFETALGDLEQTGVVDVPGELAEAAPKGVPTMAELRETFPDAARAALAAARSDPESTEGFAGFLKRQLGARSVTPREGSDPDAVLSRAEAALRNGRLTDALAETDTLPDSARAAMSDWLRAAHERVAAQSAAENLSQGLSTN